MKDVGPVVVLPHHIFGNKLHCHIIDVHALNFGTIEVGAFELRDLANKISLWDSDPW